MQLNPNLLITVNPDDVSLSLSILLNTVFAFMTEDFPVIIDHLLYSSEKIERLSDPRYSRPYLQIDERDFFLEVNDVACYHVHNGERILVHPCKGSDPAAVKLYLNGSVLGALLHQRGLIPLHGSSFSYNGKGIVVCGHTGSGKSSVVAAFCQNGGHFIDDDISPIRIAEGGGTILPIHTQMKLWSDTLKKLGIDYRDFDKIRASFDKYYLPAPDILPREQKLDHVIVLQMHNKDEFLAQELYEVQKFNTLRRMIYRKMYLKGMPETEKRYFRQLANLEKSVKVTIIVRPSNSNIYDTMEFIKSEMNR